MVPAIPPAGLAHFLADVSHSMRCVERDHSSLFSVVAQRRDVSL